MGSTVYIGATALSNQNSALQWQKQYQKYIYQRQIKQAHANFKRHQANLKAPDDVKLHIKPKNHMKGQQLLNFN